MTNGNNICANCGGDWGIHHYQTEQCPVGGVESPLGREQEWKTSTFKAIPFDPPDRLAKDLTVREYFAAMAMQGLVNHHSDLYEYAPDGSMTLIASAVQRNAQRAVQQADALIGALNKEEK